MDQRLRSASLSFWAGWLLTLVPMLTYQLLYFNRYFPITEGWFSTYGSLLRSGKRLYGDVYLLLPPLYPLQIALIQSLFGESIFVLRVVGVLVTCGIGLILYSILCRLTDHISAAAASVAATVYYQSGNAFIGYDFTQFLTFYLLVAALFQIRCIESDDYRRQKLNAFLSGVFIAFAVFTKQSNGGVASLVMMIIMLMIVPMIFHTKRAIEIFVSFAVGGLCVFITLLLYLLSEGSLFDFLDQSILVALSAKGGASNTLTGWVLGFFGDPNYTRHLLTVGGHLTALLGISLTLAIPAILLWMFALSRRRTGVPSYAKRLGNFTQALNLALGVIAALIATGIVCLLFFGNPEFDNLFSDNVAIIYNEILLVSVHLYVVGLLVSLAFLIGTKNKTWAKAVITFGLGLGLTAGNGTSAGLSEISGFLGLGLLLAFLLYAFSRFPPAVIPTLLICFALEAYLIERKFSRPYAWWSIQTADVRHTECQWEHNLLWGLCFDASDAKAIREIVRQISENSKPDENLFVFPHEPIFYLLADRVPHGKQVVTWFDFIGQNQVEEVLSTLSKNPPKVIVMTDLVDSVFDAHERLFMNGRKSVQRELVRKIENWQQEGHYQLVSTHMIGGAVLKTLVRVDIGNSIEQ